MNQAARYLDMFEDIMKYGSVIRPRGLECREIEDLQLVVDPNSPFMTFEARGYDIGYFKKEMRWKLGANKYDMSIQAAAKMWAKVVNPDMTYNSNYGQYWFGEQHGIWDVVTELIRDNDSRKAVIPMLNASHMSPQTVDTVCTECVGFRLRSTEDGESLRLNMSVHMRSSDVVFGLGTDVPTFSFLYRLVLGLVSDSCALPVIADHDAICITAMSSHIYSRHYDMVLRILDRGVGGYTDIKMPFCNSVSAMRVISSRGNPQTLSGTGDLGGWLCD
jgi:thymidylate synthase